MKKILSPVIFCLFVFLPVFAVESYDVCGNNFQASYEITNRPASSYQLGDQINTKLSIKATGNNEVTKGSSVDTVFVLDRSGSMAGTYLGKQKMDYLKNALNQIIDFISSYNNPDNLVGLSSFSASARVDSILTKNYSFIRTRVNHLSPETSTTIGGGLLAASQIFNIGPTTPGKQRIAIVATDGMHNTNPPLAMGIASIPKDVTVYAIGIGSGYDEYGGIDENTLKQIATKAGNGQGKYFFANPDEIINVLDDIFKDVIKEFKAEKVGVDFYRENVAKIGFKNASNGGKESGLAVNWANLGSFSKDQLENLNINYSADGTGDNIQINKTPLKISYELFGQSCQDDVPVNIEYINIWGRCSGGGAPPANGSLCSSQENFQLPENLPWAGVQDCSQANPNSAIGTKKCRFACNACYELSADGKSCNFKSAESYNGQCGSAENRRFCEAPTSGLCLKGVPSSVTYVNGKLKWTCSNGVCGGTPDVCYADTECAWNWIEVVP